MIYLRGLLRIMLVPFIKGSSVVIHKDGYAVKVSRPKLLARIFYLLFLGRWTSPYESPKGMRRAFLLRIIANHVTTADSRIGRPVFAKALSYSTFDSRPALIMEWVDGGSLSRTEALDFLILLENILDGAGLPTWSISTKNPTSHDDLRLTNVGIICLDNESVLPSLFATSSSRQIDPVNIGRLKRLVSSLHNYPDQYRLGLAVQELEELLS